MAFTGVCLERTCAHTRPLMPRGSRLPSYAGPLSFNSEEVAEVAWVGMDELRQWMQDAPGDFTHWFLDEVHLMGLERVWGVDGA